KGPSEKDPNHGHLVGGLLHSAGARGAIPPGDPTSHLTLLEADDLPQMRDQGSQYCHQAADVQIAY
ncbi:hypothetical protein, partial [Streptomyces chiangmaiensis]|uniref:hypothetical protein n=1 Tax=Streptomyces chiangmaiensis TaxID=766497 RepID=UPI0031EB925F